MVVRAEGITSGASQGCADYLILLLATLVARKGMVRIPSNIQSVAKAVRVSYNLAQLEPVEGHERLLIRLGLLKPRNSYIETLSSTSKLRRAGVSGGPQVP